MFELEDNASGMEPRTSDEERQDAQMSIKEQIG